MSRRLSESGSHSSLASTASVEGCVHGALFPTTRVVGYNIIYNMGLSMAILVRWCGNWCKLACVDWVCTDLAPSVLKMADTQLEDPVQAEGQEGEKGVAPEVDQQTQPQQPTELQEPEGEEDVDELIQNPENTTYLSESPPPYHEHALNPQLEPAKPEPAKLEPAEPEPRKKPSLEQEDRPKPKPQREAPVRSAPASQSRGPPSQPPPQSKSPPAATPSGPPARSGPMTPQEKKAREFIEQAEKKVKSAQGFFGSLFG